MKKRQGELSKIQQDLFSWKFSAGCKRRFTQQFKRTSYIVDEYGSTETGEMAKIMLANSYFNLRDFDKAEKYFKIFWKQ